MLLASFHMNKNVNSGPLTDWNKNIPAHYDEAEIELLNKTQRGRIPC